MDSGAMDLFKELQEFGKSKHENLLKTQLKEPSTQMLSQENQVIAEELNETEERYQVMKTLGEGGMGLVQLALDALLHREVALKTIKLEHIKKEKLNERQQLMLWRLKQEAEITAILEHPNIVPLYDLKKKKTGEIYFTMRKVQGETFSKILKKQKEENSALDREDILTIFTKVCDAVAYAHSQGVVHRDLKPDNVMVGQFGEVYVMDWGIAKRLNTSMGIEHSSPSPLKKEFKFLDKTEAKTHLDLKKLKRGFQTIGGIGTAGYMPPEQSENATNVREQADIYALGKILKQCFTCTSPLEELQEMIELSQKLYKRQKNFKAQLELKKAKEIPEDIQAIVEKATREDWKSRYNSVKEFIEDIERYRKNMRVSARKYNSSQLFWKWVKRNQRKVILGWIFFSIFLGFLGYLKYQEIKECQTNLNLAQEEKSLGEMEENSEKKMDHLLKGMHAINTSLLMAPQHPKAAQLKLELSQALIKYTCETKDYQFASYFVREVDRLESIEEKQKMNLKKEVEDSKTALLKRHQQRLRYWKFALKDPTSGMREEALLEISKMQESEILEELSKEVEEGTKYFLTSSERTSKQNEYYAIMALNLGALENPKAGPILWKALKAISQQVLRFKEGFRPYADIDFMVSLAQALNYSKASGFSKNLRSLRWEMGQNNLFSQQTEISFRKLVFLDQLPNQFESNSSQDFFSRAFLKTEIKDFEGAILDYNEAIRLNSQDSYAYHNRGNAKKDKGDIESAILDYDEAIRLNPQESFVYLNRGIAKKTKGDIEGAILDYNESISLNPQNAFAYNNRGNANINKGNIEGAILDYNKAISLNPQNAFFYNGRGVAKQSKKDIDGAILDYNEAIRINSQDFYAYHNRGNAKRDKGNIDSAILDYNEAIRLNPQDFTAYCSRGNVKRDKGDIEGAILDYNEAIRINPQYSTAYHNRGNAKKTKGDIEDAILDYSEAIRINPQNANNYYNRGLSKQGKGDIESAILDYNEAIRLNPQDAKTYNNRGLAKRDKGDIEGAILDYNEAIRLNPQDSNAYCNRGNAKKAKGNIDATILDYNEAIRLNPQYAEAYYNRGNAKKDKGDIESAILDYDEAIRLNPQESFVYLNRGIAKKTKGDIEGAILDYSEAIRINPQNANNYYNRGLSKQGKGDIESAILDYNEAIRLNPQDAKAYNNRGTVKQRKGDLDSAILDYDEAIRLNPQYAEAYYNRGMARNAKKNIIEAIEDLEKGLSIQFLPEFQKFLIDCLKRYSREQFLKRDWSGTKNTLLKLKRYFPVEDPQQKQLDQKIQQIDQLIQSQEKK